MFLLYVCLFGVGTSALISALLLADIDHDGLPFLSLTNLSAASAAAGGIGAALSLTSIPSALVALLAFIVAVVTVSASESLKRYVRSGESNSSASRDSYIGSECTVTLALPSAEDGWGEVSFRDSEGARIRAKAYGLDGSHSVGDTVYVSGIVPDGVNVVAIR